MACCFSYIFQWKKGMFQGKVRLSKGASWLWYVSSTYFPCLTCFCCCHLKLSKAMFSSPKKVTMNRRLCSTTNLNISCRFIVKLTCDSEIIWCLYKTWPGNLSSWNPSPMRQITGWSRPNITAISVVRFPRDSQPMENRHFYRHFLVGGWPTTLKNDGLRQLGWWHSQYIWKVVKAMFQSPPSNFYHHHIPIVVGFFTLWKPLLTICFFFFKYNHHIPIVVGLYPMKTTINHMFFLYHHHIPIVVGLYYMKTTINHMFFYITIIFPSLLVYTLWKPL